MTMKNRAWFLDEDGRVPPTLYVMYDHKECGSKVRFMYGKKIDLSKTKILIFNVEDTKWAKPEYIRKWDFLPNSTAIPLANKKAIASLEEIAPGQFQTLPSEIRMPDGSVILDYKLINITNAVAAIDYAKCTLKEERFRTEANKYKDYWYKKDCLGDSLHIAVEKDRTIFLGSETLRKGIKNASLSGLTFKESWGGIHKFIF